MSCKLILFFCFDMTEWLFFFLVEPVQTCIFKIIRVLIIHEHFCRVDFDKSVQRSIILLNRPFLSSFWCASNENEKFNISANLWNSFDFIECKENLFSATSIRCDQSSSSLRFANTIIMTKWEMFSLFFSNLNERRIYFKRFSLLFFFFFGCKKWNKDIYKKMMNILDIKSCIDFFFPLRFGSL